MHIVEAAVTQEIASGGFRLKVSVLDLGLYSDGWTIFPPRDGKDWWLRPPAVRLGDGRWRSTIEFDHSKTLWPDIREACVSAVQAYREGYQSETSLDLDISRTGDPEFYDDALRAFGLEDDK